MLAILAEYGHLLFVGHIHSSYLRAGKEVPIYWDDMVYYFLNEGFTLVIIIFLLAGATTKRAKAMYAGIVAWFLIEWIEITLQLLKISNARLFINDGSWLQLSTCTFISLFVYYGKIKLLFQAGYSLLCQFIRIFTKRQ
jgi:hypothetical protein